MQEVSDLYNRIIESENHYFETKLIISDGNNAYTYLEDALFSVSTDGAVFSKENPTFGSATSREINVEMVEPDQTIPRMARLYPYVRVCGTLDSGYSWRLINGVFVFTNGVTLQNSILTFAPESGAYIEDSILNMPPKTVEAESEWIQKGVFRIDTRETDEHVLGENVLRIHGYDEMMLTEQDYPSSTLEWSETSPKARAVLDEIASAIDVELDDRTKAAFPTGSGYVVGFPAGYTMREVLCSIGAMYGGSFCMSDEGKLLFIGLTELPEETNYLITQTGNFITFGGTRILLR